MVNYSVDRYFIVDIKLGVLEISDLEKYDSQKMYKIYDEWPKIARESFELEQKSIEVKLASNDLRAIFGHSS